MLRCALGRAQALRALGVQPIIADHARRWASTSVRKRTTKKTTPSSSKLVADLPTRKGSPDGALASYTPLHGFGPSSDYEPRHGQTRVATEESDETEDGTAKSARDDANSPDTFRLAVAAGAVPDSPLAEQVFNNWKRFPDCVVLTRVGKFYESYFTPAVQLASMLSLKLAHKRYTSGLYPFAGFPVTHLDKYLKILVSDLRHSVVLVEEYPDVAGTPASSGENITRRVGRIVTPGTLLDDSWISRDESRYLLALALPSSKEALANDSDNQLPSVAVSLAYADVSTGEFYTKSCNLVELEDELARIAPKEILLEQSFKSLWTGQSSAMGRQVRQLLQAGGAHIAFDDLAKDIRAEASVAPSDIDARAVWLLRRHLQYTLRDNSPDLASPEHQMTSEHMQIDAATLHALEIRHAWRADGPEAATASVLPQSDALGDGLHVSPLSTRGTLLSVLRRTVTPAGTRLLTRTLTAPLTDVGSINKRLDLVEALVAASELRLKLRLAIKEQADVLRIIQRLKAQRGDGKDLAEVGRWLRGAEAIAVKVRSGVNGQGTTTALRGFADELQPDLKLAEIIESAVDDEALRGAQMADALDVANEDADLQMTDVEAELQVSASPRKGAPPVETRLERAEREREERELTWWIKSSYTPQLTECHATLSALRTEKELLQSKLRRRYDTPSLLLTKGPRYGYFVTVSKKSEAELLEKASRFNLAGVKSFIDGAWLALGMKIDQAAEAIRGLQRQAFESLRSEIIVRDQSLRHTSDALSELDLVLGFAQAARELNLVRPTLDNSSDLDIKRGRHPAVESGLLSAARTFTPNSISLHPPASQLLVITGPNQGGKSTVLRQTALIAILAQAGSFVPAASARVGIVDRVFSRIGARDDLFRDRSTFMLEMVETAAILRQATARSMVIMDEIGRGTTLQAGVAIAFATLDHLLKHNKCRTLFATHYHELGSMLGHSGTGSASSRQGVEFWCTDVEEDGDTFSYSYRMQPGINHKSHAIKAAKLAGMPSEFLKIAESTLATIQGSTATT